MPDDAPVTSQGILRDNWDRTLRGIIDDPATIEIVNATLRRIEDELIARRSGTDAGGAQSD